MKEKDKNREDEAPILLQIKRGRKLKVPEGYFDQLPSQLLEISECTSKPKKNNKIVQFLYPLVAVAALLILGFLLLKPSANLSPDIALFNASFNNLTADGFSDNLLIDEVVLTDGIVFDDAEVLCFLNEEMQKPQLQIEVISSDFDEYFELEEEY